MEKHSAAR